MKICKKGIHEYEGRSCKECAKIRVSHWQKNNPDIVNERSRRWRKKNPTAFKNSYKKSARKQKYGVSEEMYNQLYKAQGETCAICKKQFKRTPHIDHDHKTGVVRGLLCQYCNHGIGNFFDSVEILEEAKKYLCQIA